jgi:hypothetical protein
MEFLTSNILTIVTFLPMIGAVLLLFYNREPKQSIRDFGAKIKYNAVAEALNTQGPDIHEFLLSFDPRQIRRGAGFVGLRGQRDSGQCQAREDSTSSADECSISNIGFFHSVSLSFQFVLL